MCCKCHPLPTESFCDCFWSASAQGGLTLTLDGRRMVDVIQDGPEEDRHLRTIAAHTSAYITHVRRQLRHTIPKAIVHCLVCPPPSAAPGALRVSGSVTTPVRIPECR